jgi:hypothetical protein
VDNFWWALIYSKNPWALYIGNFHWTLICPKNHKTLLSQSKLVHFYMIFGEDQFYMKSTYLYLSKAISTCNDCTLEVEKIKIYILGLCGPYLEIYLFLINFKY